MPRAGPRPAASPASPHSPRTIATCPRTARARSPEVCGLVRLCPSLPAYKSATQYPGPMIPFSVLDLSPITEGSDAAQSFRNTLDLARHAEQWGFNRYWLAEHHGMPGIASAATAVLIGHVAGGTSRIRVGSGGVMLPNHAPLVIAEQFGTLESLYPGRIDLGVGRAPGGDARTTRALRRHLAGAGGADTFAEDLRELLAYFRPAVPGQAVRAITGAGLEVPVYLLG